MQKKLIHRLTSVAAWLSLMAFSFSSSAQDLNAISSRGGWGNYRRAEVLRQAGANPKFATVTDLSRRNLIPGKLPNHVRLMVVDDWANPQGAKATFVVVPLNKKVPVQRASDSLVRNLGLMTVDAAARAASYNGGKYGTKRAPQKIQYIGMSNSKKSFNFNTVPKPGDDIVKIKGQQYRIHSFNHSVTVNGRAYWGYRPVESAFPGHVEPVTPK